MDIQAIKRAVLIVMLVAIGLICVACAAGIVLGSGYRGTDAAILAAVESGYVLVAALACFLPLERKRFPVLALLGLFVAACGVLVIPAHLWLETMWPRVPVMYTSSSSYYASSSYHQRQFVEHVIGTYFVLVGYLGFTPLVLMPRMKGFGRVTQLFAVVAMTACLGTFLGLIWDFWGSGSNEIEVRFLGASLVFSGAGALGTFVLNKFFATKTREQIQEAAQAVTIRCPRCLTTQEVAVGESKCSHCKLHFKIEVEEPRCGKCGYLLRELTRPICAECGTVFREEDLAKSAI